jgi:hypothetical protein
MTGSTPSTAVDAGRVVSGRQVPRLLALAVGLTTLVVAPPAAACPVCNSDTGQQVRAGLFGEDFGRNLLATALPFPILLGVVAAIHFGRPRRGRSDRPVEAGLRRHGEQPERSERGDGK